jgi:O-antigen/teichoic acid export membrane protein
MPALALGQLVWKLADNSAPALNETYAREGTELLTSAYLRLLRYSLIVAVLVGLGVWGLNGSVVTLWVGEAQYAGQVFSALLGAYVVTQVIIHLNAIILTVHGCVRGMTIISFVAGFGKVAFALAVAERMGLTGVMLANLLADVAVLVYLCQRLWILQGIGLAKVWAEALFPSLATALLPALGAGWLICVDDAPATLAAVATRIIGMTLLWALGGWFVGLTLGERERISSALRRVMKTNRAVLC